jgi:hypothetical protein
MKRLNITCVTNTPSFDTIYASANNVIEILSNINAQYDIKIKKDRIEYLASDTYDWMTDPIREADELLGLLY